MCSELDRPIGELATIEGIIAIIGPGKRYNDLGDFWQNVESMRNVPSVEAFEGVPFEVLDKIFPELERRLGSELKTHKISHMRGKAEDNTQSLPKQ